jgi:hypothetical protein
VTLEITGGLLVTTAAGTGIAADGAITCPVDTTAATGVAACGTPNSRRAAASITHDTADPTGATGPVPESMSTTDSTAPGTAADRCGVGTITGGTTVVVGAAETGAVNTGAAGDDAVAGGTATVAGDFAAIGITTDWSGRSCEGADIAGTTDPAAAPFAFLDVDAAGGTAAEARAARPGEVTDGTSASDFPTRTGSATAGFSTAPEDRVGRCRCEDWPAFDRADVAPLAESALSAEAESAGAAHAAPIPPMATPVPIPSATAKPPTRPTNTEARIRAPPPVYRHAPRRAEQFDGRWDARGFSR